jgi:hypothetical protein
MSGSNPCTCKGSRKEKIKFWYVPKRWYKTNYSYFEKPKGCAHYSEYSTVFCARCNMVMRSKASFVDGLPSTPPTEEKVEG